MSSIRKSTLFVVLALALGAGALMTLNHFQPAAGQEAGEADKASAGPRYTVIETEGHNLIVTDNKANVVYFYAVDKGMPVGSDLKLRASLDLNKVGQPTLTPKKINIQRKD